MYPTWLHCLPAVSCDMLCSAQTAAAFISEDLMRRMLPYYFSQNDMTLICHTYLLLFFLT